jgi:hypothetical protein
VHALCENPPLDDRSARDPITVGMLSSHSLHHTKTVGYPRHADTTGCGVPLHNCLESPMGMTCPVSMTQEPLVYQDPQSSQDWRDVASERSTDSMLLQKGQRFVAALYLLGTAVECHAKALCAARDTRVPRNHGILDLLECAGFKRTDLTPDLREFADTRDVSLRYQVSPPSGIDVEEQLRRGRALARWLHVRLNRTSPRRK